MKQNINATKIPIILCIDVEPDGFFIDRTKKEPWKGYEVCYEFFRELRPRLAAATGSSAYFSWFHRFDPQIAETYASPTWAIEEYPKFLEAFKKEGDEFGIHTHAYRWLENQNRWIADHGNQEWINYCVEMGFESFKRVFGRNCESFRFGDRWMSNASMQLIEDLGAKYDLTLEPGLPELPSYHRKELFSGFLPDYHGVPRAPYRPSKSDFRRPSNSKSNGIWEIPLSTGRANYEFGKLEKLYRRIFTPDLLRPQVASLNLGMRKLRIFSEIVDEVLNSLEEPYLSMEARTSYMIEPAQMRNVQENLDFVLNHRLKDRFVFATPGQAISMLGYVNQD
ncbi:MAG: hypothetical protein HYS55_04340 [Candidatus Omnitrophica bacterium]|nr:hypothetical protein [Candidatus Omnitrophota bacterium]